jgi:PAS domain S-box-containing protein
MMERTRPEYPGAGTGGPETPMDPDTAVVIRGCAKPTARHLRPAAVASGPRALSRAVRRSERHGHGAAPAVGEPWSFGLHQCSHARVWTTPEVELFREIGRRLADAVTSLLAFRNLHEESERLRLAWRPPASASGTGTSPPGATMFSSEYKRQLGYEDDEITSEQVEWSTRVHPDDLAPAQEDLQAFLDSDETKHAREYRMRHRDGSWRWFHSSGELRRDEHGKPLRMLGCHLDVTERKRADEERQAHVWFLESMDRVNRVVQGASDLDQLMGDVLEATLSIFDCDRAYLVHPCDPDAAAWSVLAERARPEYRSAAGEHRDIAMTAEYVHRFRTLREADGPVCFGPASVHPLPPGAGRVGIQSLIAMAVYPHADQPYAFGLHQCSYARAWTPDEERLLQEIGRRLADGLTSRFVLRSLRASEGRLAEAQRVAHVGHWNRDLVTGQVTLSSESMRIFGIKFHQRDLAGFEKQWRARAHPDDQEHVKAAMAEALRGGARYDVEYRVIHPDGQLRFIHSQADPHVERRRPAAPDLRHHAGHHGIPPRGNRAARERGPLPDVRRPRHRCVLPARVGTGRFSTWNRQACDSLGYTRDELVGMSPWPSSTARSTCTGRSPRSS